MKTAAQKEDLDQPALPIPNKKYEQWFAKFHEIDALPTKDWKAVHLLSYFARKYQSQYNLEYSWKFNSPSPSKSFEVFQINVIAAKLSKNPQIIKDYIDFVFQKYVPHTKTRFRSISFIAKEEHINDYKLNVLLVSQKTNSSSIDRAILFPSNYREIVKSVSGKDIQTYGDMAFLAQISPRPTEIQNAMDELGKVGFDVEALKRIV